MNAVAHLVLAFLAVVSFAAIAYGLATIGRDEL